jgi:hypothetical protein
MLPEPSETRNVLTGIRARPARQTIASGML